jgi:hypothetical protein
MFTCKLLGINIYKIARKCCIYTTYGKPNPFRINTYKKQGGGVGTDSHTD